MPWGGYTQSIRSKMPLGAGGEKGRQVLHPWEGLQSILQQVLQSVVIAYADAL